MRVLDLDITVIGWSTAVYAAPSSVTTHSMLTPFSLDTFVCASCPCWIAGIESVNTGIAIKDAASAFSVNRRAVRIKDVPCQRSLAVAGVFRGAPDRKGRVLAASVAVECFMGYYGVDVQLIGAVRCVHPMLGRVPVGGGLGGKGHAGEHGHHHEEGQEKRENTATAVIGMVCFQRKYLHK